MGGDAHDNCISLPGSLALCRRDRACRGGLVSARVAILIPAAVDASAATPAAAPLPKGCARDSAAPRSDAADPKSFTTTGPLVAEQQADIAAERDGRVVSINVRIGDRVKKGQLLAQLDDRALRVGMRIAEGADGFSAGAAA